MKDLETLYRNVMMTLFGHPLYWLGWWALAFLIAACLYGPWGGIAIGAAFSGWYWRILQG